MIHSDVARLPMVLSRDVSASSGREPAARDETAEIGGRYRPDLGDTGIP